MELGDFPPERLKRVSIVSPVNFAMLSRAAGSAVVAARATKSMVTSSTVSVRALSHATDLKLQKEVRTRIPAPEWRGGVFHSDFRCFYTVMWRTSVLDPLKCAVFFVMRWCSHPPRPAWT